MLINELGSFNIQWCRLFLQHVSHSAACSLRYERHGQIRTTPGKAARQLNNIGWVCSTQMLSVVFIDGAKMLSWKNVDLHSNPELRIIKTANYYHKISFNEDVYIKFKEILPTQKTRRKWAKHDISWCGIKSHLLKASSTFKDTKNFGSQISCFLRQVAMQDSPSPPTRVLNSLRGGQFVGLQKSWNNR